MLLAQIGYNSLQQFLELEFLQIPLITMQVQDLLATTPSETILIQNTPGYLHREQKIGMILSIGILSVLLLSLQMF